jgi:hypothetical protein
MLGKLRSWLAGLIGGPDGEGPDGSGGRDGHGEPDDPADPSGLDPDNVTEVRTEADEDPVTKLRDVERERERPDDPESDDHGG